MHYVITLILAVLFVGYLIILYQLYRLHNAEYLDDSELFGKNAIDCFMGKSRSLLGRIDGNICNGSLCHTEISTCYLSM